MQVLFYYITCKALFSLLCCYITMAVRGRKDGEETKTMGFFLLSWVYSEFDDLLVFSPFRLVTPRRRRRLSRRSSRFWDIQIHS